jgi:hypothetical protein
MREGEYVSSNMRKLSVTLNNNQIKTLPVSGFDLVSEVNSNKVVIPSFAVILTDFRNGIYTNIDNLAGGTFLRYNNSVLTLITAPADNMWLFEDDSDVGFTLLQFYPADAVRYKADFAGKYLQLFVLNGSSGNLTGGHAANTLKLTVYYSEIEL